MSYLTFIDLSEWNGPTGGHAPVNFPMLAQNVDGFILKASGGDGTTTPLYRDSEFTYNQENARLTGKPLGYYHFAGGGDPVVEADYFLEQVGELQAGEFLCLDFEISHTSPGAWCGQFYNRVHDKTDIWCIVYSTRSIMPTLIGGVPEAGLWIADPDDSPDGDVQYNGSVVPYKYIMQQFTTTGSKPGVDGNVDLDAVFLTLEQIAEYGLPAPAIAASPPAPVVAPTAPYSGLSNLPLSTVIQPSPVITEVPSPTVAQTSSVTSAVKSKSTYSIGLLALLTSAEKYFTGDHTLSQYLTTVQGGVGFIGAAIIALRADLAILLKDL